MVPLWFAKGFWSRFACEFDILGWESRRNLMPAIFTLKATYQSSFRRKPESNHFKCGGYRPRHYAAFGGDFPSLRSRINPDPTSAEWQV